MTVITQQLRAAYHRSGLSYQQIADLSGTSMGAVQRALNGRRITTHTLVGICYALRLSTLAVSDTATDSPSHAAR